MHTLVTSSTLSGPPGAGAGGSPDTSGFWGSLVSYLVSSPTLWEEERRKQRRERRHICLPAVGQTPTLKGSPSSFPPTVPFLQKVPGSSRRDPQEMPGAHLPAIGPFWHCWFDGFTCLHPSFDCELPDHRPQASFTRASPGPSKQ